MNRGLFFLSIVVIVVSINLSGCQDTSSVRTKNISENILLDSTIVELINASFERILDKSDRVEAVTVRWLLHNIAGKTIRAQINVQFYDKNDILLHNETKIINMPTNYHEIDIRPNSVSYKGAGAGLVDYVIISVHEI